MRTKPIIGNLYKSVENDSIWRLGSITVSSCVLIDDSTKKEIKVRKHTFEQNFELVGGGE